VPHAEYGGKRADDNEEPEQVAWLCALDHSEHGADESGADQHERGRPGGHRAEPAQRPIQPWAVEAVRRTAWPASARRQDLAARPRPSVEVIAHATPVVAVRTGETPPLAIARRALARRAAVPRGTRTIRDEPGAPAAAVA
jgi:hypothetical protein